MPASAQTWITDSPTISETNTNYDGQDLVISGAAVTVAMNGPHSGNPEFRIPHSAFSRLLINGAVLTHSPCTATETHRLDRPVSKGEDVATLPAGRHEGALAGS